MANKSLKAFMLDTLKNTAEDIREFPGLERFKDADGNPIPLKMRCLTRKEMADIRKMYRSKKVLRENGRPVINGNTAVFVEHYDGESAGKKMLIESLIEPKLNDPELMDYYGVVDEQDMVDILFPTADELQYVNECFYEACGLNSKDDEEEEIKN